jgi:hypothetical protein
MSEKLTSRRRGFSSLLIPSFERLEPRLPLVAEIEPNDALATATPFAANDALEGRFAVLQDVDHFRTSLNQGDRLKFNYINSGEYHKPLYLPPSVEVLDSSGRSVASSQFGLDFDFWAPSSNVYYVRITSAGAYGSEASPYSILTVVSNFTGITEVNPNESLATATPLTANRMLSGELTEGDAKDFFSINLTASQTFFLHFAGLPEDRPGCRLLNSAGTVLVESARGQGLSAVIPTSGTYYVEVIDNLSAGQTRAYLGTNHVVGTSVNPVDLGDSLEKATQWNGPASNGLYALSEGFLRGELTDLSDVDIYSIRSSIHQIIISLRPGRVDDFTSQEREISVLDRFGHPIVTSYGGYGGEISVGDIVRKPDDYFIRVRATNATGLGTYGLRWSENADFGLQRETPLHFIDYTKQNPEYNGNKFLNPYGVPEAIPLITGLHRVRYDFVDVDYSLIKPTSDVSPYIQSGVGDFETLNGGVGGGYHNQRRASGSSANNLDEKSWTVYNGWPANLLNHEFGHAAGLPHVRSIANSLAYTSLNSILSPGETSPFQHLDQRRPVPQVVNTREIIDYNLSAGSQIVEQSETVTSPQDLSMNLLEMTVEPLAGPTIDLSASPNQVLSGDLNADGWADLVIGFATSNIAVLLSNRAGGFQSPVMYNVDPISWWNEGVTVGDFNRDGRDDVAVISRSQETLTVMISDADGRLVASPKETIGRWPNVIQSVDLNDDGMLDLIAANANNQVTWRRGRGDGTFHASQSVSIGNDPNHLVIADFNGDQLKDICIANYANDTLTIHLANGLGGYTLSGTLNSGSVARGLAAADMDGDLDIDILSANHNDKKLNLFLNRGNGTFVPGPSFPLSVSTENLLVSDINMDGKPDVVASGPNWNIDVLLGDGTGRLSRPVPLTSPGGGVFSTVLDIDRDGIKDIATVGAWQNRVAVRRLIANSLRNDRFVVHGRIENGTDTDSYLFEAQAGMEYFIDIDAAEYQEPLDSMLTLFDSDGRDLARNRQSLDLDSGIDSVDPYLVWKATRNSKVRIDVEGENQSVGTYRLKITPRAALTDHGPRVMASIPDNGSVGPSNRQVLLAFDTILDSRTLDGSTVVVQGAVTGVQKGTILYDPLDGFLVWTADRPLAPDTYTLSLLSGVNGVRDLKGRLLDGEIPSDFRFPRISGDGSQGGDFRTTFTINAQNTSPAQVSYVGYERDPTDRGRFWVEFTDHVSIASITTATFTLQGAGPDGIFDTNDDRWASLAPVHEKPNLAMYRGLNLFTTGVPDPDTYRISATLMDAAGNLVPVSRQITVGATVPQTALSTDASKTRAGLVGSYVNQSLRSVTSSADWRTTQSISGTRVDRIVAFYTDSFGSRSEVGVTGGNDMNWENFSVQWDGFISIPRNGIRLQTRSDDGSRMWVDINRNGAFETNELFTNGWGSGQWVLDGALTPFLNSGDYAIRIQYEEGGGGNRMSLEWVTPDWDGETREHSHGPSVISQSIPHGTVYMGEGVRSISIDFSGALDLNTLNTSNFKVRYSTNPTFYDSDDRFLADADDTILWNPNHRRATFESATNFLPGYYLIELNGGDNGIRSRNGRLLDGEFLDQGILGNTNLLSHSEGPSGNGVAGGTYRTYFSVGPSTILVSLSETEISELAGQAIGALRRLNSDTSVPVEVSLLASPASKVSLPSIVTIPAGRSSVDFLIRAVDNHVLDGDIVVVIQAISPGFLSEPANLLVRDYEKLTIGIDEVAISEKGGRANVTISRPNAFGALEVQISNSLSNRSVLPTSVVIPQGAHRVTVQLDAIDNETVDGEGTSQITASSPGFVSDSQTLRILDHEQLVVQIPPIPISERGGRTFAKILRTDSRGDLVVGIQSSPTGEVLIAPTITITDGNLESPEFAITAVDDGWVEPSQMIQILGTALGYLEGQGEVEIIDYEELVITFDSSSISERDGQSAGKIRRMDARADLFVRLSTNASNQLMFPQEIMIPKGALVSPDFFVTAIDNSLLDGTRNAMVYADAAGYVTSGRSIQITDYEELTIQVAALDISEFNGQTTGFVTRTDPRGSLLVNIGVSDNTEAAVFPSLLAFTDGSLSSEIFTLKGIDDSILDGTQPITIRAKASSYQDGVAALNILDFETLKLSFSNDKISEKNGTVVATIRRNNTDTNTSLTVQLATDDPTELLIPKSVVIPAGKSSVDFTVQAIDDDELDGSQFPRIVATATGYQSSESVVEVQDYELLRWTVSSDLISENQGRILATLSRPSSRIDYPLLVFLTNSDGTELNIPSSVIIPTDQNSISFEILGVDDDLLDGNQSVSITAIAGGFADSSQIIRVSDYEQLLVSLNTPSISEYQGFAKGTLRRTNSDINNSITVNLTNSNSTKLQIPLSVVIPAGALEAQFDLRSKDDALLDGTQTAIITASAFGYILSSQSLQITDYELINLVIDRSEMSELDGEAIGTVSRGNTDISQPLTVQIQASRSERLQFPQSVIIPAGKGNVSFAITAIDNSIFEGTQTVAVSASSNGYIGTSKSIQIKDHEKIQLESDVTTFSELNGQVRLRIKRSNTNIDQGLLVRLSNDDGTELSIPEQVQIPPGIDSIEVIAQAIDDNLLDGNVLVQITASADGYVSATQTLRVDDHEELGWSMTATSISERKGTSAVTLFRPIGHPKISLNIALDSSDPNSISMPESVSMGSGIDSVSFVVTAIRDLAWKGNRRVQLLASSVGYAESAREVTVIDAVAWTNPLLPYDVDADRTVSPLDVLVLINDLNRNGTHELPLVPDNSDPPPPYLDPDDDGTVSPLDALVVINYLNSRSGSGGEGESESSELFSREEAIDQCMAFFAHFDEGPLNTARKKLKSRLS